MNTYRLPESVLAALPQGAQRELAKSLTERLDRLHAILRTAPSVDMLRETQGEARSVHALLEQINATLPK